MFLGFFGLGVLAFKVGERHVQRFVPEACSDRPYAGPLHFNFRIADDTASDTDSVRVLRQHRGERAWDNVSESQHSLALLGLKSSLGLSALKSRGLLAVRTKHDFAAASGAWDAASPGWTSP
jgi:hypothetical protein